MWQPSRRQILQAGAGALGMTALSLLDDQCAWAALPAEIPAGPRPPQDKTVQVLNPRDRVPLSFIIDDSTCLVNMGRFCMPQFRTAWPQNPAFRKKWKDWPAEIPDAFVREFGEFCGEQGVRGKYSLVPYPACVGWLDRDLPGWPRKELHDSVKLARELIAPRFDITPEMITHTSVIDLKSGRPMMEMTPATMENWYPPEKKSADEIAAYIAYSLRILKNCEIPCEGITTPGGFGNKCQSELSAGVRDAVSDVFGAEIPHYFKYIAEGVESTQPRLEHVEGLDTDHPRLVVNVPAGTGDWFGNWDGDTPPQPDKYITEDGSAGRMLDLIERGEPAVMFGHWAGLYSNGSKKGFEAARKVITTINGRFADRTIWMKTSELARYWAARQLTRIERNAGQISLTAPFAVPTFTLSIPGRGAGAPRIAHDGVEIRVTEVAAARDLKAGTWRREKETVVVCFDLPKGRVALSS